MSWLEELNENTWIVSDTHFYHFNINKYEPSRLKAMSKAGFNEPDEFLIYQWNSVVKPGDLVLHLGDFSTKKGFDVIQKLNGRIILILGNHDIPMVNKLKKFVEEFPGKLEVVYGVKDCQPWLLDPQWSSGLIREMCGFRIMFSHYPLVSDNPYMRGNAKETRDAMAEVFKREACEVNIHGHVHTNDEHTDKNEINVSIERIGFKPVKIIDLLTK
ncbi:metallophosphoesterase family protein [Thiomicrorhabdus sp. Milos-T2]|uniref:metallophosphoesterase family protein n=1 Tax=Thiomicrorhabdus sp. Milos-T2 TaxID=90814 RepID=UPI00068976EA|nr:metallophosphoesterase family protein [Thiomicrorhabdus sp. Milos-T2]